MKKLFTNLLLMLVLGVSGAWAETKTSTILSQDFENCSGTVPFTNVFNGKTNYQAAWTLETKSSNTYLKGYTNVNGNRSGYVYLGLANTSYTDNWTMSFDCSIAPCNGGTQQMAVTGSSNGTTSNATLTKNVYLALTNTAAGGTDYNVMIGSTTLSNTISLSSGTLYNFNLSITNANTANASLKVVIKNGDTEVLNTTQTVDPTAIGTLYGFFDYNGKNAGTEIFDNILITKEVEAGVCENPTYTITGVDQKARKFTLACATDGSEIYYSESELTSATGGTKYESEVTTEATTIWAYAKTTSATSEVVSFSTGAGTAQTISTPTIQRTGPTTYTVTAKATSIDGITAVQTLHYTIGGGDEQTSTNASVDLTDVNGDVKAWATADGFITSAETSYAHVAAIETNNTVWSYNINGYPSANSCTAIADAINTNTETTLNETTVYNLKGVDYPNLYVDSNTGWLLRNQTTSAWKCQTAQANIVINNVKTTDLIHIYARNDKAGEGKSGINGVDNGTIKYNYNVTDYYIKPTADGSVRVKFNTGTTLGVIEVLNNSFANAQDITNYVINPSFEANGAAWKTTITGWTNTGAKMQTQTGTGFDKKVSDYYVEQYSTEGDFAISQTLSSMPAGFYVVSANAKVDNGTYTTTPSVNAGGNSIAVSKSDTYYVAAKLENAGDITIGYSGTGATGVNWSMVDDFHVTYYTTLPDVTATTGKMNANVQTALTTAKATYDADKTAAYYNAFQTANNAAKVSIAAYATAAKALAKAADALNTNVCTTTAKANLQADYSAAVTKYNEGSYTDAEATALNFNDKISDVVSGSWTTTSSDAFHTNTWSVEGDTDGSNYTTPFIEDWVVDGSKLADTKISATMTGLVAGDYKVTAKVRLYSNSSITTPGLTLQVNEGDAVSFSDATSYGNFQIANMTVKGTVASNGSLTIAFNLASTDASWLSIKNVKYEKLQEIAKANNYKAPENTTAAAAVETAIAKENMKVANDVTSSISAGVIPANAQSSCINVSLKSASNESGSTVVTSMTFDIEPQYVDADGNSHKIENGNINSPITFRLPIDAKATYKFADVYHSGNFLASYEVLGDEEKGKYIEVSSKSFSTFRYDLANNATAVSSENLNGYKTFYNANSNYQVDANTTIYTVTAANAPAAGATTVTITPLSIKIIPKGTPVILKTSVTSGDNAYKITLTPYSESYSGNEYDNNQLSVATAAGAISNAYILAYVPGDDNGFGFYKYTGSFAVGDVYVTIPASGAKLNIVIGGETTAVKGVATENATVKAGKYLDNGKLVIKTANGTFTAAGARIK